MPPPRNALRTFVMRASCILVGLSSCVVRLSDPYTDISPDGNVTGAALDCTTVTPEGHAAPTGDASYRIIGRTAPPVAALADGSDDGDPPDPNNPTNDPTKPQPVRIFYSGTHITARFTGASIVTMDLAISSHANSNHIYDSTVPPTLPTTSTPTQQSQADYALSNPQFTYYSVTIDGGTPSIVTIDGSNAKVQTITLATALDASATHEIVVSRESEEEGGAHVFYGLFSDGLGTVPLNYLPATVRPRKMQIIGDSISCGFGVLGANAACDFSYETERESLAYGPLAATMLDAELTTVAKSGIGVYKNSDGTTSTDQFGNPLATSFASSADPSDTTQALQDGRNMAYLYTCQDPTEDPCDCAPQTLNADGSYTAAGCDNPFIAFDTTTDPDPPDVIVINLGTNDVLLALVDGTPFETAYFAFVRTVRTAYPNAQIFCAVSPMLSDLSTGGLRTLAVNAIHDMVSNLNAGTLPQLPPNTPTPTDWVAGPPDSKIYAIDFPDQGTIRGLGCAFHPNTLTQQIMANQLATAIHEKTCW